MCHPKVRCGVRHDSTGQDGVEVVVAPSVGDRGKDAKAMDLQAGFAARLPQREAGQARVQIGPLAHLDGGREQEAPAGAQRLGDPPINAI